MVFPSGTTTHTIFFKPLNGGSFKDPQITTLKVATNAAIEETRIEEILSYPSTGPKPSIQAVARDIFEWRNNGTKYELSNSVTSTLTLEAVWSNSCGKTETFHPANRDELKTYTDKAISDDATTNLNHIDTSAITDMTELFKDKNSFNGEIGCWNTAKVTNMRFIFSNAYTFNGDIGKWDVSKVNNMVGMFSYAWAFNQDIGKWDVSKVNNMVGMFSYAWAFNQDIGKWDVSKVNNMVGMFFDANAFNGDIGGWNVANVTNMFQMFYDAYAFNQDIGGWNVANVTDMRWMFYRARAFVQDLTAWQVSRGTSYSKIFKACPMFLKPNLQPIFF